MLVKGSMALIWAQWVGSNGTQEQSGVESHSQGQVGLRKPALCDNRCRMVMASMGPKLSCTWASSGMYFTAGSSRDNFPRSRNCRMAMAVMVLVIEAQL